MPITKEGISSNFFKRACDVASYYGFQPLEHTLTRLERSASPARLKNGGDRSLISSVCFAAGTKLAEPLFFYYVNERPRGLSYGEEDEAELNLEIVGTTKSIAEAILLKTALSIFEENGQSDVSIAVNGIGDRDCLARFSRELSGYYRKHLDELHAQCRNNLAKDVFRLLSCDNERCKALADDAPRAMNFLTETNRSHFREVLEYLEGLGIPYEVEDSLLGFKDYYSRIVFEVRQPHGDATRVAAAGGRYDDLARRVSSRKDAAGAGISILFPRRLYRAGAKKQPKSALPKAYFVHIGFEAKLKSLAVLDLLRKSHIGVYQALHHDQLSGQLLSAEKLGIPYLLIMGQKEALEGTVIVRDVETRAQESVPIARLPVYLRSVV